MNAHSGRLSRIQVRSGAMSRFYRGEWEGITWSVRPVGHRRLPLLRRTPYLTGDPARFHLMIRGRHPTVTHAVPELERPNGAVERLQPLPLQNQDFAFHPLADPGFYRMHVSFEHISVGRGFVSDYRVLAATIQVMEDYKPLFFVLSLVIGAVIGAAVGAVITLLIQALL